MAAVSANWARSHLDSDMIARCAGTFAGAWIGAALTHAGPAMQKWIGWCLFPQAGVALGMALLATQRFPEFEAFLLPVVLASTVVYEITAPAITRRALQAAHPQSNDRA